MSQDNVTTDVPEMAASSLAGPVDFQQTLAGAIAGDPAAAADLPSAAESHLDTGAPPEALPPWLADADAEERRELEELGALPKVDIQTEAARDELISTMLRVHHEHSADVERYDEAEKLEHERITQRYDRLRRPGKTQISRIGLFILHLVEGAKFVGRKKSRSVGWGSYGLRKQQDKVIITDAPVCTSAVQATDPESVKWVITTNGRLAAQMDNALTTLITSGNLEGDAVSYLSAFRAHLRAADRSVGLTAVGKLLDNGHEIAGATIQTGRDKAWFETEPPTE
jgi:hypothetical protein